MARKQLDLCIFCDSNPCTCNTTLVTKKPKPKLEKDTVPAPRQPQPQRTGLRSIPQSQELAEFRTALTVLCQSGLILSEDIEAHRGELLLTKSEIEVLLWKQRRLEWQHFLQERTKKNKQ